MKPAAVSAAEGSAWALKATVAASPSSTASPVSVAVGATLSTSIVVVYARRPSSLSITAARTVNESSPSAVNDAGTSIAASGEAVAYVAPPTS